MGFKTLPFLLVILTVVLLSDVDAAFFHTFPLINSITSASGQQPQDASSTLAITNALNKVLSSRSDSVSTNTITIRFNFLLELIKRIFNKFSSIITTKVNVVLWVKQFLINTIVNLITYFGSFIASNHAFVAEQLRMLTAILTSWVKNYPYFIFPNLTWGDVEQEEEVYVVETPAPTEPPTTRAPVTEPQWNYNYHFQQQPNSYYSEHQNYNNYYGYYDKK